MYVGKMVRCLSVYVNVNVFAKYVGLSDPDPKRLAMLEVGHTTT